MFKENISFLNMSELPGHLNTSRQKAPPGLGRSDPKPGLASLLEQVELEVGSTGLMPSQCPCWLVASPQHGSTCHPPSTPDVTTAGLEAQPAPPRKARAVSAKGTVSTATAAVLSNQTTARGLLSAPSPPQSDFNELLQTNSHQHQRIKSTNLP